MMRSTLFLVLVLSTLLLTHDAAAWRIRIRGRRILRRVAQIVITKVATKVVAGAILAGKRSEDNGIVDGNCSISAIFNEDSDEAGLSNAVQEAVKEFEQQCN